MKIEIRVISDTGIEIENVNLFDASQATSEAIMKIATEKHLNRRLLPSQVRNKRIPIEQCTLNRGLI